MELVKRLERQRVSMSKLVSSRDLRLREKERTSESESGRYKIEIERLGSEDLGRGFGD